MVDKRTVNGNNGTHRGPDKKPRKRPTGYYVLKDEVKAGLRARLDEVRAYYGTPANMVKRLKISYQVLESWKKTGRISVNGAMAVHRDYLRNGCKGYRATFCRPDLRFDSNGKALTRKCDRREMLRVVK
ncbi:hypothetical protein [Gibbsiella quercinecans]|uniref:hypothetical protein n=1 Tax=Gibbsiella quercinecans TaxID=929813 RepID=UPI00242B1290|nr:hypothetical protein [Gibbsiella quercinecans]